MVEWGFWGISKSTKDLFCGLAREFIKKSSKVRYFCGLWLDKKEKSLYNIVAYTQLNTAFSFQAVTLEYSLSDYYSTTFQEKSQEGKAEFNGFVIIFFYQKGFIL